MNTHFMLEISSGSKLVGGRLWEIKIKFRYPLVEDRYRLPTTCTIEVFNATTDRLVQTLTGKSYCSENDQFRKKTGRLIALQRAATTITPRSLRKKFLKMAKS